MDEMRFLKKSIDRVSQGPPLVTRTNVLDLLRDRMITLETGLSPEDVQSLSPSGDGSLHGADENFSQKHSSEFEDLDEVIREELNFPNVTERDTSETSIIVDDLAWGRQSKRNITTRNNNITLAPLATKLTLSPGQDWKMPTESQARVLISFHTEYVCWLHNSIYSPDFLEVCEMFWKTGDSGHPLWLALYLSVMSVSSLFHPCQSEIYVTELSNLLQAAPRYLLGVYLSILLLRFFRKVIS